MLVWPCQSVIILSNMDVQHVLHVKLQIIVAHISCHVYERIVTKCRGMPWGFTPNEY